MKSNQQQQEKLIPTIEKCKKCKHKAHREIPSSLLENPDVEIVEFERDDCPWCPQPEGDNIFAPDYGENLHKLSRTREEEKNRMDEIFQRYKNTTKEPSNSTATTITPIVFQEEKPEFDTIDFDSDDFDLNNFLKQGYPPSNVQNEDPILKIPKVGDIWATRRTPPKICIRIISAELVTKISDVTGDVEKKLLIRWNCDRKGNGGAKKLRSISNDELWSYFEKIIDVKELKKEFTKMMDDPKSLWYFTRILNNRYLFTIASYFPAQREKVDYLYEKFKKYILPRFPDVVFDVQLAYKQNTNENDNCCFYEDTKHHYHLTMQANRDLAPQKELIILFNGNVICAQ